MCAWLHCSLYCSLHFSSCRSLLVICLVLSMTVLKNIYILRGDGDESDSNFIQLLRLRGEDDPKVIEWMQNRANK